MIYSDQIYHDNFLRPVKDVEETQDPDPSKQVVCVVTGEDYLWWALDFSVEVELSCAARVFESLSSVDLMVVSARVLLILPVVLLSWVAGLILEFVWLKKGNDFYWKNWYPKFDVHVSSELKSSDDFSGEFSKMELMFGLQQYILLEESFFRSFKKISYRVVDHASTIQTHPYVCGMLLLPLVLGLLLLIDDPRNINRFRLRDSGYERFWFDDGILVLFGNHFVSCL